MKSVSCSDDGCVSRGFGDEPLMRRDAMDQISRNQDPLNRDEIGCDSVATGEEVSNVCSDRSHNTIDYCDIDYIEGGEVANGSCNVVLDQSDFLMGVKHCKDNRTIDSMQVKDSQRASHNSNRPDVQEDDLVKNGSDVNRFLNNSRNIMSSNSHQTISDSLRRTVQIEEKLVEPSEIILEPSELILEPSEIIIEPSEIIVEPSEIIVEPSEIIVEPIEIIVEPSEIIVEPSEIKVEPSEIIVEPSQLIVEPSELIVEPSELIVETSEIKVKPSEIVVEPSEKVVEPIEIIVDPGHGIVEPGQGILDPGQGIVEPGEGIVEPDEGIPDPGQGVVEPGQGVVELGLVVEPDKVVPVPEIIREPTLRTSHRHTVRSKWPTTGSSTGVSPRRLEDLCVKAVLGVLSARVYWWQWGYNEKQQRLIRGFARDVPAHVRLLLQEDLMPDLRLWDPVRLRLLQLLLHSDSCYVVRVHQLFDFFRDDLLAILSSLHGMLDLSIKDSSWRLDPAQDAALTSAVAGMPRLRRLALPHLATDAVLGVLVRCCPQLEILDVCSSRRVTDAGVRQLLGAPLPQPERPRRSYNCLAPLAPLWRWVGLCGIANKDRGSIVRRLNMLKSGPPDDVTSEHSHFTTGNKRGSNSGNKRGNNSETAFDDNDAESAEDLQLRVAADDEPCLPKLRFLDLRGTGATSETEALICAVMPGVEVLRVIYCSWL